MSVMAYVHQLKTAAVLRFGVEAWRSLSQAQQVWLSQNFTVAVGEPGINPHFYCIQDGNAKVLETGMTYGFQES